MNQGKYNEDRLVGAPLKFPTTTEAVQDLLKQIGIDGIRYEEIFIASYDGPMPQLHKHLGEYESIDELNHLACLLSELDKDELERFIEELSQHIAANGKSYINYAAAIRIWAGRDRKGTGKKGIPDYSYKEGESL